MRAKLTLKHGAVTQNQYYDKEDFIALYLIIGDLFDTAKHGQDIHIRFFEEEEQDDEAKPKE